MSIWEVSSPVWNFTASPVMLHEGGWSLIVSHVQLWFSMPDVEDDESFNEDDNDAEA